MATTPGVLRLGSSRPDDTVIEMEGVSDGERVPQATGSLCIPQGL